MHFGGDKLYEQYKRRKLIARIVLIGFFLIVLLGAAGYFSYTYLNRAKISKYFDEQKPFAVLLVLEKYNEENKPVNLYLGVSVIYPSTSRIGFISFFPHTKLSPEEASLGERLSLSGIEEVKNDLSEILNFPIPFYVRITPDVVSNIIDLVEGINYFLWQADVLDKENLPFGEFTLDGETAKRLIEVTEKNDYSPALQLFRQYSLILNLWQQRVEKWGLLKNPRLFNIISKEVETNMTNKELFYLAENFFSIEGWLPLFFEVPLKRVENSFVIDTDANTIYLKDFNKKLTIKENPFYETFPRMEIKNGTSIKNLARKTRIFFSRRGIQILEFSNADHNNYENTILLNISANPHYLYSISKLTGIKRTYFTVNRSLFTDIILIIGNDYENLKMEN
ncbi:MAG: LCP family protein [Spirochaetia bacterium]|nr:LCP family protein [Spirochaetia bacterium]